tara:strand:- start:52 stop:321 length:270 start_codon:yes stop_codon:yes gene_type:complete
MQTKFTNNDEYEKTNISLNKDSSDTKEYLIGRIENQGKKTVALEDIVDLLAKEIPEVLLHVAEENWMRGYEQALQDRQGIENLKNEKTN